MTGKRLIAVSQIAPMAAVLMDYAVCAVASRRSSGKGEIMSPDELLLPELSRRPGTANYGSWHDAAPAGDPLAIGSERSAPQQAAFSGQRVRLSVVIPCFNEVNTIMAIVRASAWDTWSFRSFGAGINASLPVP